MKLNGIFTGAKIEYIKTALKYEGFNALDICGNTKLKRRMINTPFQIPKIKHG